MECHLPLAIYQSILALYGGLNFPRDQGKLGVVMLAMHDINKKIFSILALTCPFVVVAHAHEEFACKAEPCLHSLLGSKVWANAD